MAADGARLLSAIRKIEEQSFHIAECRSIIDQKDRENRQLHDQLQATLRENRRLQETIDHVTRERDACQRKLQDTTDLSNQRGVELMGAQSFLSKADKISSEEVKEKLVALNEEIFQTAASLGEGMVGCRYDLSRDEWEVCAEKTARRVGEGILGVLQEHAKRKIEENQPIHSLLVQVVIQVFLVDAANFELVSWDPNDRIAAKKLRMIYTGIQASEQQPVCGRWRALTAAQLPQSFDDWRDAVKINLIRIFKVASWRPRSQDQLEGFYRRLEPMFKVIQDLRTAIWRNVTSEDYRIQTPKGGDRFAERAMLESYGDEATKSTSKEQDRIILGTTSIGLCKLNTERGFATKELMVVVESEVVIESTFRAALSTESNTTSLKRSRRIRQQDGHG